MHPGTLLVLVQADLDARVGELAREREVARAGRDRGPADDGDDDRIEGPGPLERLRRLGAAGRRVRGASL